MTVKLTEGLVNGPDPKRVREFNGSLTVYASFVLQPQTGLKLMPHIFKIGIVASSIHLEWQQPNIQIYIGWF